MNASKYVMVPFAKYKQLNNQPCLTGVDNSAFESDAATGTKNENLLAGLPHNIRKNSEIILKHLDTLLNWNDKLEIIIDGQLIEHSNIVDLLKSVQYTYKNFDPIGMKKFLTLLINSSVPRTCFKVNTQFSRKSKRDKLPTIDKSRKWINI